MILFEDNHLLIVKKLPGELVQGDETGDKTVLDKYKAYIKKKYKKPGAVYLHPVHRLDRPVSGCLILARTSKALSRMTAEFRNRNVQKTYHAICSEKHENIEGLLVHFLVKDKSRNISKAVHSKNKQAKEARLNFKLIANKGSNYLYEIKPLTGRSHQIRVQLASVGIPIIGDVKYKGRATNDLGSIYLHCTSMSFIHPIKKELQMVSCLPEKEQLWNSFVSFLNIPNKADLR